LGIDLNVAEEAAQNVGLEVVGIAHLEEAPPLAA
jgi:hypothetical protein